VSDRGDLESTSTWWSALLLFVLIVLCAGTPDLLDAIVDVVRSWAVCP
jgi:hypothetical protein